MTQLGCLAIALVGCSGTTPSGVLAVNGSSGNAGATTTAGSSGNANGGAASSNGGTSSGAGGSSAGGGAGGVGGAAGTGGSAGGADKPTFPSGPSTGCNLLPAANLGSNTNTLVTLNVPSCGTGPVTPHCVAPAFSPGGTDYVKNQQWDYNNRNLGIQLPANYDPSKPYPVIIAGGGCSTGPDGIGGGYSAGTAAGDALRIGISKVGDCFADGGLGGPTGHGCAVDEAHIGDCVNSPEVPYVNAVLDYVEARFCVDLGKIFIGGYSSGAWEAATVSCALANRIRGMSSVSGGLRNHRPECTGPSAAFMIVDGSDNQNPIGPLVANQADPVSGLNAGDVTNSIKDEDSNGAAPMRDEILMRNGCQGTGTAVYDPAYPACVTYTGCPKSAPVVWCVLPGLGHAQSNYQNIDYGRGAWSLFSKLVP